MPSTGRVADFIVQQLAAESVGYLFGVGGANIEDIYDAAAFCEGITAVLAKHEFSAATMADGYSRAGAGSALWRQPLEAPVSTWCPPWRSP